MTPYWEFELFLYLFIAVIVVMLADIVRAWVNDRRKWKKVPRHIGTTYDASVKVRPNVRRA